jgi:hypothetical protein
MADKVDAVIKVKRGLENLRRTVLFADGELAYSTDVKRLFVGDGGYGGNPTSSKVYYGSQSVLSSTYAISGDFFVDTTQNISKLWSLTGSDYTRLSAFALICDTTPAYEALACVQANSASWGLAGGAAGAAAYATVNALSANWQATYFTVNNNYSRWNFAADNVLSISLAFQTQSAQWDSTYTNVKSNSARWESTYTSVLPSSANWNMTYTTVQNNSAGWAGGGITGTVEIFTTPLTASGKFLVTSISGVSQAIRLWDVP